MVSPVMVHGNKSFVTMKYPLDYVRYTNKKINKADKKNF